MDALLTEKMLVLVKDVDENPQVVTDIRKQGLDGTWKYVMDHHNGVQRWKQHPEI